jgi:glyoxalase family protein
MEPKTQGLHHITAITSDASSAVNFYTGILGLRLVKKTVNFDDPSAYHLYFGNERGNPGTLITFFDWGKSIGFGQAGAGVTHHFAFTTRDEESLANWKTWLEQNDVSVLGSFDRGSFKSIYFRDPDGLILEIATPGNGRDYSDALHSELILQFADPTTVEPRKERINGVSVEMKLQGLHHVTALTHGSSQIREFFAGILNMELVKDNRRGSSGTAQQVFGLEGGRPGSMISFVESSVAPHGAVGVGTVHHIAFAVEDEDAQLKWRERLLARGVHVTPVLDRKYFKSIYFRESNGILLELATIPPGFGVDEPMESLGQSLALPDWLESRRRSIEASLEPISLPAQREISSRS